MNPWVSQHDMCGALPASQGTEVPCAAVPEHRFSNEAAQILKAHLKAVYNVSPEAKRARVSDLALKTPHGPAKAQKLHLAFPKPCTQAIVVPSPLRTPHQPSKAARLQPQSKQAAQRLPSTLRREASTDSSQGCFRSANEVGNATDKRGLNGIAPAADNVQWTVHTPVSHAVYMHLRNSILRLKAAPIVGGASSDSLASSSTVGLTDSMQPEKFTSAPSQVARSWVKIPLTGISRALADNISQGFVPPISKQASCVPLIQPAAPKPRKKVWQYRQYSAHAPSDGQASLTSTRHKRKRK